MATVLLIDDDEDVLRILAEALRSSGHTVLMGTDGTAGLKMVSGSNIDVIVTDLIMPGMEGLETITGIRVVYPEVKIIAMSGGGAVGPKGYLELARAFGAHATLRKPFPLKELTDTVSELTGDAG